MSLSEIDKLIFDNWSDLDRAAARANQLEDAVFEVLYETVEQWCSIRGWIGSFDLESGLWFAAPVWSTGGGKRPAADAWFQLELGADDEEDYAAGDDYFWLTRLMTLGVGSVGFRLRQERRPKREWGVALRGERALDAIPAFTLDDVPSLYMPLKASKEKLERGFAENDIAGALDFLPDALKALEAAVPAIDALLGPRRD